MIEVGFAIILGFAIASTLCGLMSEGSRGELILKRALISLIILSVVVSIVILGEGVNIKHRIVGLAVGSVLTYTEWFILGASLALAVQLYAEGHIHNLWIRFHPQSAPTPEVRAGQRARIAGFGKANIPATLVGASTEYLKAELDLRTETLIRLCYYAFEDRGALTLSTLESNLHLGTGHRQKAFHKIAASMRGRPKLKKITHRYWRSVNGSSRMSQALFSDLNRLARETRNNDRATLQRLSEVGQALGLRAEEMSRSSSRVR